MDRPLYLVIFFNLIQLIFIIQQLGYLDKENRLFASDKDHNIVSYKLLLSVLEYQTAVMRRDFDTADRILKTIPESQATRVAQFLEKQACALLLKQSYRRKFSENICNSWSNGIKLTSEYKLKGELIKFGS